MLLEGIVCNNWKQGRIILLVSCGKHFNTWMSQKAKMDLSKHCDFRDRRYSALSSDASSDLYVAFCQAVADVKGLTDLLARATVISSRRLGIP